MTISLSQPDTTHNDNAVKQQDLDNRKIETQYAQLDVSFGQELDYLQQDIASTSHQALNDKAAVDSELDHLSSCVLSFQQRITQVCIHNIDSMFH